jgi:hypothetical protein
MPIAVDGYVVVALVLWMAPVPATVAAFARKNTYCDAGIGIAAQSAYHLLFTLSTTNQAWRVALAAIVGAIPPAVAGLAVHMRALIRRESSKTNDGHAATPVTVTVSTPTVTTHRTDPLPNAETRAAPTIDAGPAPSNTTPPPWTTTRPTRLFPVAELEDVDVTVDEDVDGRLGAHRDGLVLTVTAWRSRCRSFVLMVTPLSGRTGPRNHPC